MPDHRSESPGCRRGNWLSRSVTLCSVSQPELSSWINPAHFLFATNGIEFQFGNWDSKPILSGMFSDLLPQSALLAQLQGVCARNALESHAIKCLRQAAAKRFLLPYNLAGGPALLATVQINQFAQSLLLFSIDTSHHRNNRACRKLWNEPTSIRMRSPSTTEFSNHF